jgi:arsenate reductase (thioredoxin)
VSADISSALRRGFLALSVIAAVSGAGAAYQQATPSAPPLRVLFLCPHGAAKSVMGAAYFQKLAADRGLPVEVDARGTEPDPAVSPAVAQLLRDQGYAVPVAAPKAVTAADTAAADIVVSMGCTLDGFPAPRRTLRHWDVPGPGENLAASSDAIRQHVRDLVDELLRR